jgi:hypothetical protein
MGMSGLLILHGRLLSTTNILTKWCFHYNLQNTLIIYVKNLMSVEFLLFIKTQFTTNAQSIFYLTQCTHGQVWSWTVPRILWSREGCKCFDRHHHRFGEVSFHFKLELNTLGFLIPDRKKLSDRDKHFVGLYLENVCPHILIWIFSLF